MNNHKGLARLSDRQSYTKEIDMPKSRTALVTLFLITLSAVVSGCVSVAAAPPPSLQITLSGPHSTTSWDASEPERIKFDLPLVYLHRERTATAPTERTLDIQVAGLAAESTIDIELSSWHTHVATQRHHRERLSYVAPARGCSVAQPCTLRWTLDASQMPSDFYHVRVYGAGGGLVWRNPDRSRPDFVALDTWDVAVGAYDVRVTYGTLFPFARGPIDYANRLAPDAVRAFIGDQFVKIIQETWQAQVETWGFGQPLQPDWDRDKVIEVLITPGSLALFEGTGTYSVFVKSGSPPPERRIWWLSDSIAYQRYDTLANAYRAIFAHEFFHLLQWNVLLSTSQPGHFWLSFVEGQARLAQSVQYPELELHTAHVATRNSIYAGSAADFLIQGLNGSYQDLEADTAYKYATTLYWRFLYEQYRGLDIVQGTLEAMADAYDAEIVGAMGPVMNRALARSDGPFQSFEESLVAFARANYALRLENGRCSAPDPFQCSGLYYDPDGVYADPPLEAQLYYDGARLTENGAIPASYGMDFVEIRLASSLHGRPLTVSFQGEGTVARFDLQVWKLGPGAIKPRAVTPDPEEVPGTGPNNGLHAYTIPSVDTSAYDRLALIVTRLDPDESADPVGAYHITID